MLKGLEASEVRRAQLNDDTRVDAEYFRKRYIAEDAQISRHEIQPLGELAFITDGQHGYHEVDEDSPIHMLTAQSARGWFTDTTGADRIARWVDDNNKRSSLQESDLILSTRGTVGLCAIVMPEVLPANIDQDVARLHIKSKKLIPEYLLAYLNSSYGQDWMARNQSGMVQQGLSLAKVRVMPIPLLPRSIQQHIAGVVGSAYRQLVRSRDLYAKAVDLLLESLGLKSWQLKEPLSYEASSKEVVAAARWDAEYFRPRHKALINILKNAGAVELRQLFAEPIARGISPIYSEDGDLLVVNSQHVGSLMVELDCNRKMRGEDLAETQQRALLRSGDVLLNSTGVNTIGRCQTLLESTYAVADNHVAIIRVDPKRIDPVFLGLFLNSMTGFMQSERGWTGSSGQIELRPDVIASFLIWDAPRDSQRIISEKILDANQARQDSKDLLEKAQRAVEIAIERGEAAANEYLDGKAYVAARALPAMTEQHKYFGLDALKQYLVRQKLTYAPETVNAYVGLMKNEGKIFSAGRGWYSSLETPFEVDPEPVTALVADIEKKFPLLDFSCWSTGQLNPYLHHMLGKFVPFVYVDRDAMSSVYDALQELGYNAYLNPTRREVEKSFNVADKTVVIRPAVTKAPGDGHVARVEKLLVDLHVELEAFPLIERDEFREAAQAMISQRRIELAKLITYAAQRKVAWREIFMNPDAVVAVGEPA